MHKRSKHVKDTKKKKMSARKAYKEKKTGVAAQCMDKHASRIKDDHRLANKRADKKNAPIQ